MALVCGFAVNRGLFYALVLSIFVRLFEFLRTLRVFVIEDEGFLNISNSDAGNNLDRYRRKKYNNTILKEGKFRPQKPRFIHLKNQACMTQE